MEPVFINDKLVNFDANEVPDMEKPVSGPQQAALDQKADKDHDHPLATIESDGFMSKEDKIKLYQTAEHPTGDGNLHVPATGTNNAGKYLKAGAQPGEISWEEILLNKAAVGLDQVDNTSDLNKPPSAAVLAELDKLRNQIGEIVGGSHTHPVSEIEDFQNAVVNLVNQVFAIDILKSIFVGASPTPPATNGNGYPLVGGEIYVDTSTSPPALKVFDGAGWVFNDYAPESVDADKIKTTAIGDIRAKLSTYSIEEIDDLLANIHTQLSASYVLGLIKSVDGSGSGLDADLLDGENGAFYRNASNINAGTVPDEHIPANILRRGSVAISDIPDFVDSVNAVVDGSIDVDPPAQPTGLDAISYFLNDRPIMVVSWNAASADTVVYSLEIKEGTGNWVPHHVNGTTFQFDVISGVSYQLRVRAYDARLNASVFAGPITRVAVIDTVPPAKVTGVDVTGGFEVLWVKWNHVDDTDLEGYEVYLSTTNAAPAVNAVPTYSVTANQLVITSLSANDEATRYVWVRAYDRSGNRGDWSDMDSATPATYNPAKVAESIKGLLNETSFATGLEPIKTVSSLPNPVGYTGASVVFNTADGKLYRYTNGAWEAGVEAADIQGKIDNNQIDSVAAAKISGQITNTQIEEIAAAKIVGQVVADQIAAAAIDASKFASMVKPIEVVGTLPTTGNTVGRMVFLTTDQKLYRYDGTKFTAATAAADITGQVVADQIASGIIDASKFASNIKPPEILSALPTVGNTLGRMVFLTTDKKLYRYDGTKFVSTIDSTDITGQLTSAQIQEIVASKITGLIDSDQIRELAAAKVAGLLTSDQIQSLQAGKISGQLSNSQIEELETNKLIGQIVADQIANGVINAVKLADNIKAVETVDALPTTGNVVGRVIYLKGDGKLYRYTATGWSKEVSGTDVDGKGLSILDLNGQELFGSSGKIGTGAYVTVNGNNIAISTLAANSITPSIHFVGNFATEPTQASLADKWRQNAVYKNTTDGKSYILTGNPLYWEVYLEDGQIFSVHVESTNGTTFRVGQGTTTTLKSRVFKNGAEVTDQVPASWFKWRRVSLMPADPPNDDATFNATYAAGGYKQLSITINAVNGRATFFSDVISP